MQQIIMFALFILVSMPSYAASMLGIHCDQILDKTYFKVCYDYRMKGARVVSYTLDGNLVNKLNLKKRPRFYPDRHIPERYRSYPSDYTRNPLHMDRGHMASDASFDWSYKSQKSTYVMSNIVPQFYLVN
ncbi:MAG: DNA/RNA non-specific endonuclease, partial [Methanobacteriota archaeon]